MFTRFRLIVISNQYRSLGRLMAQMEQLTEERQYLLGNWKEKRSQCLSHFNLYTFLMQIQQVFTNANMLTEPVLTLQALHPPSFSLCLHLNCCTLSQFAKSDTSAIIFLYGHKQTSLFKTANEDLYFVSSDHKKNNGKNAGEIMRKTLFLMHRPSHIWTHKYNYIIFSYDIFVILILC